MTLVKPLTAILALLTARASAQSWSGWDDSTVVHTIYKTYYTCPCDGSLETDPAWANWALASATPSLTMSHSPHSTLRDHTSSPTFTWTTSPMLSTTHPHYLNSTSSTSSTEMTYPITSTTSSSLSTTSPTTTPSESTTSTPTTSETSTTQTSTTTSESTTNAVTSSSTTTSVITPSSTTTTVPTTTPVTTTLSTTTSESTTSTSSIPDSPTTTTTTTTTSVPSPPTTTTSSTTTVSSSTTTATTTTTTTTAPPTPTPTFYLQISASGLGTQYLYITSSGSVSVLQFTTSLSSATSFILDPTTGLLTTTTLQAYADFEEVNVGRQYFATPSYINQIWQSEYQEDEPDYYSNPDAPYPLQTCVLSTDGLNTLSCQQTNYIEGFDVTINLFEYCSGDGSFAFNAIHNCNTATVTAVEITYG
ncbi:hypothetical protein H2198_008383 [Neophaeococcomyces mojaviensis]|uniref:Uncharacterized protein n=1 Tax=Neophaeococcomyces mojaviensis TaxID=3383035 RepID=A0ACC2ZXC1_9EURO|nr:hypothetical protein H2198_008383 [Knufia sp. JES_112]